MTQLVFGVIDIPYENAGAPPKPRKGKRKRAKAGEPTTTVMVATWLEDKYGVMGHFYDAYKDQITGELVESLEGALEDMFAGAPPARDPFADGTAEIGKMFKTFLMTAEIESMGVEGVPTQAAIERRSLRFKDKISDHARPSFVNTGIYEAAFTSWVEQ